MRVKTNIDFSRVKINGIKYNFRDLDQTVHVPERNRLIVETYLSHVPGEKAVVFCASVAHAEEVAHLFRDSGVAARVVEGCMKRAEREQVLDDYRSGIIKVLCACDILNEGWDSPETAVLFMARPTLSKVVYLQQLGRGTRRAPGKEALLVFDFVDRGQRHNQSLDLHRLLKMKQYRSWALVIAPPGQMEAERRRIQLGEKVDTVLPHNIFARDYEIVDLFDWQEEIGNMMSMHELAMELYVDDQTVLRWLKVGRITPGPDLELPLGKIVHRYFRRERLDDIRAQLKIPARKSEQIREDFFKYVEAVNMSASYKPVMLKAMLTLADSRGQVELAVLTAAFRRFYMDRAEKGLLIEIPGATMNRVAEMNDLEVARVMLTMPFEKFERKFFLEHRKDLNKVAFVPSLWKRLTADDREKLVRICDVQITDYYEKRVNR